jgi:hypothetical protein
MRGINRIMCCTGWVALGAWLTDVGYAVWLAADGGPIQACPNGTTAFLYGFLWAGR